MFVAYDICFFFFLLLIEIIFIAKLLIIVHFFVLKHEKQTLSYVSTKFEGDRNISFFFLQFILWEHLFFCPNTENYLGLSGWCPWNYLVRIGLRVKIWNLIFANNTSLCGQMIFCITALQFLALPSRQLKSKFIAISHFVHNMHKLTCLMMSLTFWMGIPW